MRPFSDADPQNFFGSSVHYDVSLSKSKTVGVTAAKNEPSASMENVDFVLPNSFIDLCFKFPELRQLASSLSVRCRKLNRWNYFSE